MAKVLTNLLMNSSTIVLDEETDFPGSPTVGQFCFKGGVLYLYAIIDSSETWYPLTNKNQHYVFTQGISSTSWVIGHNLQTEDVIFIVYDENNVQMIPSSVTIDSENQITLTFLSGEKGKCVVFGASEQYAPAVNAGILNVGDNITLEGTSITVSGVDIVALLDQTQTDLNAMFSWNGTTEEITFKGDLIPENDSSLNIGSATKKIKDLYVSATTVHVGDNATFEGTSLAIDAGASPTSAAEVPTIQASNITLKPFTYNPGGGEIEVRPVFQFQVGGQNYPISFDTVNNKFSFDAQGNVGQGVIACKDLEASGVATVDSIRTTGTAEVRFDQSLRVDGDVDLGYDDNNTISIKGVLDVQTPVTFGEQATLGDGNDDIAVNCGAANDFTIIANNVTLDAAGKITAGEVESSGDLTVQGNLYVNGETTTVDTATLQVEDNEIVLNKNQTGDGITAGSGGIEIERGNLPNARLIYNEATDKWQAGITGSMTDLELSVHNHDSVYLRRNADALPDADDTHSLGSAGAKFSDIHGTTIHGELDGNAATATALETARNITLSGDVTGTVSFDGTGDAGITAAVVNDSHTHDTRYYTETEQDTRFLRRNANSTPSADITYDIGDATHRFAEIYAQTFKGVAENAAKLNNARDISLSGDVTGSVSFDGSANVNIVATVANDSHNHDNRYYTETEIVNNYANLNNLNTDTGLGGGSASDSDYPSQLAAKTYVDNGLAGKLGTTAKAADSELLDGVNGSAYLRSNVDDTFNGTLSIAGNSRPLYMSQIGEGLSFQDGGDRTGTPTLGAHQPNDTRLMNLVDGNPTMDGALLITCDESVRHDAARELVYIDKDFFEWKGNEIWHAGNDGTGSGLDADTVDGVEAANILRKDVSHQITIGNIAINNIAPQFILSESDDVAGDWHLTADGEAFTIRYPNTGTTPYPLRITASGGVADEVLVFNNRVLTVADEGAGNGLDADTVDGYNASNLLKSGEDDYLVSAIVVPDANRDEGIFGTYDQTKTQHIWSMGTSFRNSASGADFGNLYGAAYQYSASLRAVGHQLVWAQNGSPTAALGNNIWTSGIVSGQATSARYADLAEKYTCAEDDVYPGTIMKACDSGEYEVEECGTELCKNVAGVCSADPGYLMNDESDGVVVGLTGKVPVRIIGPIGKGQVIVSAGKGAARAIRKESELLYKIGQSIEENLENEEKLVMCIIK